MKKLITLAFSLFGLLALQGIGPLALAARPSAPVSGNTPPQQSGKIEYLDLAKGIIVINDREYALSDTVTVNGRSGDRHSLRNGMRVNFSVVPDKGRNVVSEINTSQ